MRRIADASARASGADLVPRDCYSPLPALESLPSDLWDGPLPTPGVDLRLDAAERLLRDVLSPFIADFDPPAVANGSGFFLMNDTYGPVDAETLYAMVRHVAPRRVVEFGSGASSHVIARARADAPATPIDHWIFDPDPFQASPMGPVDDATVARVGVETLTTDDLSMLEPGDILFIDTTHTVKTGGDCQNIYLRLLPELPAGVHVHVHDIFLPFEYPRHWVDELKRAWAEQYLLQALLANNARFEVVLPCHALTRMRPGAVASAVPSFSEILAPGAFWMRTLG